MRTLLSACLFMFGAAAAAQTTPSHCIALSGAPAPRLWLATTTRDPVPEGHLRIDYDSHSTFLIETPGGTIAATDYAGYIGGGIVPDAATMNRAHPSHYTSRPDPRITHILRGWDPEGGTAEHLLDLGDMRIRNVATDLRDGAGGRLKDANSIFIFEAAGLCIAHLGHLHHEPSDEQFARIGRVDVLLVPVDGGLTLDTQSMARVVERLRARAVIPMHWFSGSSLERFLARMRAGFAIEFVHAGRWDVSLLGLPAKPTILVLRPRIAYEPEN